MKDLNTRPETLQLVQERVENTLELIYTGITSVTYILLQNMTQIAQQLKERIGKWDYKKFKSI
jgi:hypothetical protein